jgi:UDPglucose 6-dehydrogenase
LAVELCDWLLIQGALVRVYDPAVKQLPRHWVDKVVHCTTALDALKDAQVLVVCTDWPEFKQSALGLAGVVNQRMIVVDANRHLQAELSQQKFKYLAVGTPSKTIGN